MQIIPVLRSSDLAVGGTAAALAQLIAPGDAAAQEVITRQSLEALRRAAARPLDMRRLVMTARLAEIQALLLTLRTYRAAQERSDEDGDGIDLDWLLAAERSLESMVQGEVFLATNPTGLSANWLDATGSTPDDAAPRSMADYRRRAELIAIADLELALAPEPVPQRLLHHLTCPNCAPDGGWFGAFGVFLGWQLRKKPHLLEPMMGVDLNRPGWPARQRLESIFDTARQLVSGMERRLLFGEPDAARSSGHPACAAIVEPSFDEAMVRTVASVMDAPAAPLANIVERLARTLMPAARRGRAVRQHAMVLAALHERWRRPEWRVFAPAHEALCAGHLADAAHWAHTHIADTASGLAERADLEYLSGRYLEASDLYGRALEATDAADVHGLLSLQLGLAGAVALQSLTTGAAEAKTVAVETAQAVWRNAVASKLDTYKLRAAWIAVELEIVPAGAKRGPSRVAAIAMLDQALMDLAPTNVSLERVEAEALRIELLTELATIDAEARPRHYEAAEKMARSLAALDLSPLPAWVGEFASAAIGRGLLGPLSNVSDAIVQQAQEAIEMALSGDLATMDPHLAGLLRSRLADVHLQLAKGAAAKARNEAGILWLGRALRHDTLTISERVSILQRMRAALVLLAKGNQEEWRLCQALAALNTAGAICPSEKPSAELGSIILQRAQIWARLRTLSKDLGELKSAVADADVAVEIFRHLKSPGNIFSALRTKANVLFDSGRDERDADLVGQSEAIYASLIADHKALKINDRDLCQTHMSRGDAADLRGVLLVEPGLRAAGRDVAREAYRQALSLAVARNLPAKGKCEAALKKLEATLTG